MSSNVEVPALGESVTEAVLSQWLKGEGDQVAVDEPLCELESDKATVDLPSPASGVLHQIKHAGETAHVGEVIAKIEPSKAPAERKEPSERKERKEPRPQPRALKEQQPQKPEVTAREKWKMAEPSEPEESPTAEQPPQVEPPPQAKQPSPPEKTVEAEPPPAPPAGAETMPAAPEEKPAPSTSPAAAEGVRRVPMSKIRRSIAERLVRAQQTSAMLTTFNEIDMTAVQELRSRHGERFKEVHGVSLGLTSFFARACVLALKQFPVLNAQIDNGDIVYHDHVHLGIAVSTDRGLVVPVLHNVETMSLPRIESEIKRAAAAVRDGKLSIQDLSGGTFTITNGGVFGSLLSTPILNPPQTGILGLHAIQERPVVVKGKIEARRMMYVALTYDHRLADGKDSASFLVRVKELVEDPMEVILEI